MMKVEKIWRELEAEHSIKKGLLYKRFSPIVKPDVYIAIKAPEKLRCIAAHISSSIHLQLKSCDKLRDIKIETMADEKHHDKQFLLVLLLNNQHCDIFSSLCEDLVQQIADINQESALIKHLLSRLERWQLMFEKMGQQGLSSEEQIGLYGELYFLRKFLQNMSDSAYCINSWKGPEKSVQDFQYKDWAVEIKTTHGKNQQKIFITSERQLDIKLIRKIFLIHYSLEVREGYGETLIQIITDLYKMLESNPSIQNAFNLKLLEAGYYTDHEHLYGQTGYSQRGENIYKITEDFPKIAEAQIPSEVGDVHYSIIIPTNVEWMIDEKILFQILSED